MKRNVINLMTGLFFAVALCLTGCGGGTSANDTPALTSISIAPADPGIALGATQQFTATGTYSDSSTQDMTASVTWNSSDTGKASISNTGLATAAAAGVTTISAVSGGISATTTLTVQSSSKVVEISPSSISLTVAEPQTFTATVPGVPNATFSWSVSGGTILQAVGGTLHYQAPDIPGPVLIMATSPDAPGIAGRAEANITRPASVTVGVTPSSINLYPLQSFRPVATVAGTFLKNVDWFADGGTIEIIDPDTVKWIAPPTSGAYQITARSQADPGVFQSVIATVLSPPLVIWLTPSSATIPVNGAVLINLGFSTNEMPGVDVSVSWSSSGGNLTTVFGVQATFTASVPGIYTVRATSNSYPSVVATSQITVQ